MTKVNIQGFVMYNVENNSTTTCDFNSKDVRKLIEEYMFGNPPMVISLSNLICIRKCDPGVFLCMEISNDIPSHHEVSNYEWFYKGTKVEMKDNYSYLESYMHDLSISPNPFWKGYLSTR